MAQFVYIVVTPEGAISEPSCALTEVAACAKYLMQWMPPKVALSPYAIDVVWKSFREAGYRVARIALPDSLKDLSVCNS